MQTIAKRDAVTLIRTASAERQQRRQIVALADRADAPGLLLLVPCGDAAGDAQPNLRIELDHVGRCEICGSEAGPSRILTTAYGATRTSTPGPGALISSW